ncbi:hypothetical protein MUB04_15775 [Acinetobacter indicus]|uniref:hypothetical protein n=1 Tax=Acinetobacter TaxID=469 RepID=UPI0015D1364C|nr:MULTISPECIES: hypothetical protein [Acinetobacter]MCP0917997.1 hypothetical protein [Acinetobacter indicus]
MENYFISAKNKLAEANEDNTGVLLDSNEAAALFEVVKSMHIMNLKDSSNTSTITPKSPAICTACFGSGYYDGCDKDGNNIRCGDCNGEGTVSE